MLGVSLALARCPWWGLAQKVWLDGWDQTWAGVQGGDRVWGLEGAGLAGRVLPADLSVGMAVSLPLARVALGSLGRMPVLGFFGLLQHSFLA